MPAAPAAMKAGTATSTTNVPPRRQRITCAEKRPGRAALRYHTRPPRRGIIAGILGSSACRYGGGRDHHRCRASGSLPEVHAEEWILRRTSALRGRKTGGPDGIETPIAGFFRFSTRDRVKRVKPGPCRSAPARPLSRAPLDQAALTSIALGVAARGAGTLTSSMPFAYFASTWAASTPSGRVKSRWNAPYATSRMK